MTEELLLFNTECKFGKIGSQRAFAKNGANSNGFTNQREITFYNMSRTQLCILCSVQKKKTYVYFHTLFKQQELNICHEDLKSYY